MKALAGFREAHRARNPGDPIAGQSIMSIALRLPGENDDYCHDSSSRARNRAWPKRIVFRRGRRAGWTRSKQNDGDKRPSISQAYKKARDPSAWLCSSKASARRIEATSIRRSSSDTAPNGPVRRGSDVRYWHKADIADILRLCLRY